MIAFGSLVLVVLAVAATVQHEKQEKIRKAAADKHFDEVWGNILKPPPSVSPDENRPEQGEPIDFASFYAKMRTNGLTPGKHYRFEGTFKENLDLVCPPNGEWAYCLKSAGVAGVYVYVGGEEALLKQVMANPRLICSMVAAEGFDNEHIFLKKVENCH
jgi:hypothetical protein